MSVTATERTEILKLIVLMFNAAPGATYLSQLVSLYESEGHSLPALANTLDDLALYNTLNPNFQTAAEFAASFLAPLGLQNDTVAKNFIIGKVNAGEPKGQIAYEALQALEIFGPGGASQYQNAYAILINKTAVAEYYSVHAGIAQTDFNFLQLVLGDITADPASVAAAEAAIDAGTLGVSGIEVTLSPTQDTVVGTAAGDTVNGLFGDATITNNTYTAGDSIDAGPGTDRLNLVAIGVVAAPAVTVKNVESITIQDTVGATFDALLVENAPSIGFTNTVAGQASMVTNAALASVMGLSGPGNLTVDYAVTTGSADTAKVSLSGVGTSTAGRSVVNVADGNTVEKVVVATSGTNFVTLTGGTVAASLVITGAGTNNFGLSAADSLAAVATIDASASTGTNTFALGTNLNTGTTIKGGAGADTVSATLATPTLVAPTMIGVETLSTTWTAAAVVDLGTATGLTTVTASDQGAAATDMAFQNAASSVTSLVVKNVDVLAANSNLKFSYSATDKGDLGLTIGSTSATATAVDLGAVTLANTKSVAIGTLGALAHNISGVSVAGNQTSLTVTTADHSSLGWGTLTVAGNVGSYAASIGAHSSFSGYTTINGDLGSMSVSVLAAADYQNNLRADNVGNVTINATGNDSHVQQLIRSMNVGNIAATTVGDGDRLQLAVFASGGGTIGDIHVSMTGDSTTGGLFAFTHSSSGGATASQDIGNLAVAINGAGSQFSGYVVASQGDVGTVSLTVQGNDASGSLGARAIAHHDGNDYGFGGNVGDTALVVAGDHAHGRVQVIALGGDVGAITASITGEQAGGRMQVHTREDTYSGAPAGDIGNLTFTVGKDAGFSGSFTASSGGSIGDIAIDIGQNGNVALALAADSAAIGTMHIIGATGASARVEYGSGGSGGSGGGFVSGAPHTTVGDVTAAFQNDGHLTMRVSGGYDFGNISATFGDSSSFSGRWERSHGPAVVGNVSSSFGKDSDFSMRFTSQSDVDLGNLTAHFGNNGHFDLESYWYSNVNVGNITVDFADNGSFLLDQGYGSLGDVGNITATFGNGGDFRFEARSGGGTGLSIGSMNLTFGTGASAGIFLNPWSGASYSSVGSITLTGGDAGSTARVEMGQNGESIAVMGGVNASAWLGSVNVDLAGVTLGTTVRVGAGGSYLIGTEGADNFFLGAGLDHVQFDTTPTAVDTAFGFTAGVGQDQLVLVNYANFATNTHTVNEADTLASGDAAKLTDIAGGQDITTSAGLLTALNAGGEYALIDSSPGGQYTIITAASAGANSFYVFEAVGNAVTAEFDSVTLIGVVNTTTPFSSLVAANITSLV